MSISPQSLARTRDKRSLRIPRKFEDFSLVTSGEVPPEVSREKTYRHFADALKMKGTKSKRHAMNEEPYSELNAEKPSSGSPVDNTTTDSNKIEESSKLEIVDKKVEESSRNISPDSASAFTDGETAEITSDDIDLECKETASVVNELPLKKDEELEEKNDCELKDDLVKGEEPKKASSKTSTSVNDSVENMEFVDESILNAIRRSDDNNVIKKSPFHPSITISNGVRLSSSSSSRPLTEKKPPTISMLTPPTSSTSSSRSSSSRKKSKGFSLMVKPPTNNGTPLQSNINRSQTAPQQTTKYYNNLAQNMQYGTRLMLNEPIYLPRSVATIPPITTTLQQIANQAKKPPFLSKKSEAYYMYQEERKFSYMMSNYTTLIRIAKHLDLQDLLNLRLVNRSWKSIVDCEAIWQKVTLKSSQVPNLELFAKNILSRYNTSELILDEYEPVGATQPYMEALAETRLKRIYIKTVNENQNRFALELISGLSAAELRASITWKVKVVVDDSGFALVPLGPNLYGTLRKLTSLYPCYEVCPDLLNFIKCPTLVEIGDLEDLFNQEMKGRSTYTTGIRNTHVDVEPI